MKSFEVIGERKFEFTKLVKYPFFEAELRRRGWTKLNEMIDEANNKTVIVEFFANARVSDTPFQSFVRGKYIDFSPDALNAWLNVQAPEECWVEKLRRERFAITEDTFDEIITTMCRPGSTWKKSRMLTYAEMLPVPKAWVSYVVQTLESASCTSEIPLKRVLAAYAIIKEHPIDIGRLLANSLHDLATGNTTQLGHGSLINWLCEQELVPAYDSDLNTSNMKPITDSVMDGFVKKYEGYMKEREREAARQQQMEQGGSSSQGGYAPLHPKLEEFMHVQANWMNETSDQLWVNRPRFSAAFAAEAQLHMGPIRGSYERFGGSREHMEQYFTHQEEYGLRMRREITDDFNTTEQDQGDGIFEGLRTPGAGHSDDDVNMG